LTGSEKISSETNTYFEH